MKKATRHIPLSAADERSGKIPIKAAIINEHASHYLISFRYYNEKNCELRLLEKNKFRACIDVFKRVTQSKIGSLKEQNIDEIRISNAGQYKQLYNKLPHDDIQILEHKIQSTSRIFYFLSGPVFYITAIKNNHLETGKIKR